MVQGVESSAFGRNLIAAGGETGRLIVEHDWTRTGLGPVEVWPQSLRTAVDIIVRSSVPMVLLWGEDGVMLYNDAYSVFAGGRHPGLLGSKVCEGWPEAAEFNRNVLNVGLSGVPLAYRDQELTLYRNGVPEQVWMDLDYSPFPDEVGAPAGVLAIVIETTQRVLAERRAEFEGQRLLQAFEQVPSFIIVMRGPDHVVEFVNNTHRRIFGSEHWVGKPMREAFSEIEAQGFYDVMDEVYASGQRYLAESAPIHYRPPGAEKAEQRFFSFIFEPTRDASGRIAGILCEGSDVTERENAAAQLRQAQKMEAVGQLTGGLAHDFNNLLSVIIGNLDFIEGELEETSPAREYSGTAIAAALKGSELTRQLLAFSRRQPLDPQLIDLNQLVFGMASLWRRTLGGGIEVRVEQSYDLHPTRADRSQVESALLNLALNARDAMPSGGVLTVETANLSLDDKSVTGRLDLVCGDYSVISVSDTGSGMSPETLERVFEPFFTTKETGKGSGLGLSMIYGFAKQSGGHVTIYSEQGRGTTVRLYLPWAQETSVRAQVAPASRESPQAKAELVLVVEDDAEIRRLAVRQLHELGYRVLDAETGSAALAVLHQEPGIDLLFTDIVMPGGTSGIELAAAARRLYPELKVLFTSGFTEAAAVSAGGLTGSDLLISKPYRKAELALRLRDALRTS